MANHCTYNKPVTISAFIICHNEEKRIRQSLDSIVFCDEIVVVDCGSQDSTLQICREYTDKIFHNPWPGYCAQKQFALARCTGKWILNIDADEVVSEKLREEIIKVVGDSNTDCNNIDGFELLRVVHYLGKWWRRGGWYPEYRVRLCRRDKTGWGGEDPHEKAEVAGKVVRLKGELQHFTHDSITDHVASINSLTSVAAQTLFKSNRKATPIHLFAHPLGRFLRFYVVKRGYREGFAGLLVAVLESSSVFLKYTKLWELNRR